MIVRGGAIIESFFSKVHWPLPKVKRTGGAMGRRNKADKSSESAPTTIDRAHENEFAGRDAIGLMDSKSKTLSEAAERSKYAGVFLKLIFMQAPALAWAIYGITVYMLPGGTAITSKLVFIHEHSLGGVFAAWFLVYCTRAYASLNANGARHPARCDRPDQHIYKIMAESGPLADAPYVMMATSGAAGRFNRAQRAAFNMDEALPLFISGLLLQSAVFGLAGTIPALLYCYGSVMFCNLYKVSAKERGRGFLPKVIAESLSAGLVGVCAVKGLLGPVVPI